MKVLFLVVVCANDELKHYTPSYRCSRQTCMTARNVHLDLDPDLLFLVCLEIAIYVRLPAANRVNNSLNASKIVQIYPSSPDAPCFDSFLRPFLFDKRIAKPHTPNQKGRTSGKMKKERKNKKKKNLLRPNFNDAAVRSIFFVESWEIRCFLPSCFFLLSCA